MTTLKSVGAIFLYCISCYIFSIHQTGFRRVYPSRMTSYWRIFRTAHHQTLIIYSVGYFSPAHSLINIRNHILYPDIAFKPVKWGFKQIDEILQTIFLKVFYWPKHFLPWFNFHSNIYFNGATKNELTHWGRVTHLCVTKLTAIGLSPGRRQAIIWINAAILWIGPLRTNFSEILIEIFIFSFKTIHLKISSENGGYFVSASICLTLVQVMALVKQATHANVDPPHPRCHMVPLWYDEWLILV